MDAGVAIPYHTCRGPALARRLLTGLATGSRAAARSLYLPREENPTTNRLSGVSVPARQDLLPPFLWEQRLSPWRVALVTGMYQNLSRDSDTLYSFTRGTGVTRALATGPEPTERSVKSRNRRHHNPKRVQEPDTLHQGLVIEPAFR
jgi:hypothetical protein